jgi:spermidine dehydrogenase
MRDDAKTPRLPLTKEEQDLGMGRDITRRDFLNAVAIGAGAALLGADAPAAHAQPAAAAMPSPVPAAASQPSNPWAGFSGVGDYARANGNTWDVVTAGHGLRDGLYEQRIAAAAATNETYDLVVVGGGFSGMAAAYFYLKEGGPARTVLILDNNNLMGGEAKRNEFVVRGQRLIGPQGSNDTDAPRDGWRGDMWRDLGLPPDFEYGKLRSDRTPMLFGRDNFIHQVWADDFENHGFFFDEPTPHWVRNPWGHNLEGTPWSPELRRELLRWQNEPVEQWKGDPAGLKKWLDSMTYEQYLTNVRKLPPEVARYADPLLSASIGLGSDVLSAYAAFYDEFPGFTGLSPSGILFIRDHKMANVPADFHSFPGGNDGIMRCIVKALIPDAIAGGTRFADIHNGQIRLEALDRPNAPVRMRPSTTVVRLVHDAGNGGSGGSGEPATITYARDGRLYTVRGRTVIWAAANWTAKHAIQHLPEEYRAAMDEFPRAPMLVANVALDNWRFLYKMGYTACSWRGGFGFTANIRPNMYIGDYRPPLDPDQPNILTFYVPFNQHGLPLAEQGKVARTRLFGTTYREYESAILQQMVKMFSPGGFDPKRDVAGIVLNRWGHAYITPGPGFYAGRDGKPAPSDVLRRPLGTLSFAHSELAGNQNWIEASTEGRRAAHQALEMLKRA